MTVDDPLDAPNAENPLDAPNVEVVEPEIQLEAELAVHGFAQNLSAGVNGFKVIRDDEELSRIRSAIAPAADTLVIDFEDRVGVLATLGRQGAIWKYIGDVAAWDRGDRVEVEFVIQSPEACDRALAESYPYALASVARSALPYAVSFREDVTDCD
jgi:hypothetical protein